MNRLVADRLSGADRRQPSSGRKTKDKLMRIVPGRSMLQISSHRGEAGRDLLLSDHEMSGRKPLYIIAAEPIARRAGWEGHDYRGSTSG